MRLLRGETSYALAAMMANRGVKSPGLRGHPGQGPEVGRARPHIPQFFHQRREGSRIPSVRPLPGTAKRLPAKAIWCRSTAQTLESSTASSAPRRYHCGASRGAGQARARRVRFTLCQHSVVRAAPPRAITLSTACRCGSSCHRVMPTAVDRDSP